MMRQNIPNKITITLFHNHYAMSGIAGSDAMLHDMTREKLDAGPEKEKSLRLFIHNQVALEYCSSYAQKQADAYAYYKNGKPYFPAHSEFQFSLSHTGHGVCAAFSKDPIGIDLQKQTEISVKVLQKIAFADELEPLLHDNNDHMQQNFNLLWTLKEAYVKQNSGTLLKTGKQVQFDLLQKQRVTLRHTHLSAVQYMENNKIKPLQCVVYLIPHSIIGQPAQDPQLQYYQIAFGGGFSCAVGGIRL